jgi:DNA-binding response OmpR family regulator
MTQRTVLVVDDDRSIRELIAELLDEAGFAVLEADTGGLALRLAREHRPSVVLMDARLPDMSGLDVLERLRTHQASRHIPVMLVSGLASRLVDLDHGADSVLGKPFNITALLEQVEYLASYEKTGVA